MKSTETSTGTTVYKFPTSVKTPLHNLYNGGIASNTVSTGGGSPTIKDVDYDKMKFNQHIVESQRTMQLNDKNVLTFGGEYRTQGLDSMRIAGYGVGTNKTPKYKSNYQRC